MPQWPRAPNASSLNKGPAIEQAVEMLDRLLARMDEHILKKTPTLRALKSW